MRAVCTSSQPLLVTGAGKCSAGYGRNPFLLLFLTLSPFHSQQTKKEK